MTGPDYFEAMDAAAIRRDFPVGEAFLGAYRGLSRD